ncbi:MAG: thymidylate synthase [Gammaproteobacteria bacterium]
MQFEALYYGDRLKIVNPAGDVGVTTLWSRIDQMTDALAELGIDLSPETSRISVVGNLFGNGLPHMLRNLLWNPQIRYLVVAGSNLSGSKEELVHFFEQGLEQVEFLGDTAHRIKGTQRMIDGALEPHYFAEKPSILALGKISEQDTKTAIASFFRTLPPPQTPIAERIAIEIPETSVQQYPSEPRNHTVLRDTPLDAWKELVFRLMRFGQRTQLKKGKRIELQNVKVVIERPQEEADTELADYGFSLASFKRYQQSILNPDKPEDQPYSYGNRMRAYFFHRGAPVDSLAVAVERLSTDPETRHAYVSLWDNSRDLPEGHECPCLVSLFFRRFDGKLTLTATFRTHNGMTAWLENVYGLMAIQRYVAERTHMETGAITVISHSISIAEDVMDKAKRVADAKETEEQIDPDTGKREPRYDYNGNFTVTIDTATREIVVQHSFSGMTLTEYRGKNAETLEKQIARDHAVSEISHALYLGREIARKEAALKKHAKD